MTFVQSILFPGRRFSKKEMGEGGGGGEGGRGRTEKKKKRKKKEKRLCKAEYVN